MPTCSSRSNTPTRNTPFGSNSIRFAGTDSHYADAERHISDERAPRSSSPRVRAADPSRCSSSRPSTPSRSNSPSRGSFSGMTAPRFAGFDSHYAEAQCRISDEHRVDYKGQAVSPPASHPGTPLMQARSPRLTPRSTPRLASTPPRSPPQSPMLRGLSNSSEDPCDAYARGYTDGFLSRAPEFLRILSSEQLQQVKRELHQVLQKHARVEIL